jgi:hypothetical protein
VPEFSLPRNNNDSKAVKAVTTFTKRYITAVLKHLFITVISTGLIFEILPVKTYTMAQEKESKKNEKEEKAPPIKPDPETLHTPDPQENMTGPVSSLVNGVKDAVEENDKESKEEATRKRDEHM